MGKQADLTLVTMTDGMELPGMDQSKVRVISAAMNAPTVESVELAGSQVATDLAFAGYTDYSVVSAGSTTVEVKAGSVTAAQPLDLVAGATYTVVVQDVETGVGVLPIQDFAAANQIPTGGVDAGLGGSVADGLAESRALVALAMAVAGFAGLAVTRRLRTRSR